MAPQALSSCAGSPVCLSRRLRLTLLGLPYRTLKDNNCSGKPHVLIPRSGTSSVHTSRPPFSGSVLLNAKPIPRNAEASFLHIHARKATHNVVDHGRKTPASICKQKCGPFESLLTQVSTALPELECCGDGRGLRQRQKLSLVIRAWEKIS